MHQRTVRHVLIATLLAASTAGCGIIYRQPIYQGNLLEKANVDQLAQGMSREQVITLLGTPSVADPFNTSRWDYTATQRLGRTNRIQSRNLTLWFEVDALARWEGDYFAEQDEAIARNSVRQFGPNLAKDKDQQRRRGR